jgi:DNA-directed RNA polymerase specialized sigma24 family protein
LREKLFVHKAIARYSGSGDLRRWVRVIATRAIYDHLRVHRPATELEDHLVPGLRELTADVTLAKAQLRAEIRQALGHAFAALTDRQKLLVQSELRGSALPALAASYRVHVRSIQRWVRDAHAQFLDQFRQSLAGQLRVAPGELSSVLGFARSQLLSALGDLGRESAERRPRAD